MRKYSQVYDIVEEGNGAWHCHLFVRKPHDAVEAVIKDSSRLDEAHLLLADMDSWASKPDIIPSKDARELSAAKADGALVAALAKG